MSRNNQRRNRRRGQGQEMENQERNTIFKSVWQCLVSLLSCLLSAATTTVHTLSWIAWVPVQLCFQMAWILLLCGQLGLYFLARVLSICLESILVLLPWSIWLFMLIEGVDLGCSIIRLTILAAPFVMSKRIMWSVQLMVNHMFPSWLFFLRHGNRSSVREPATVTNIVEQCVDNRQSTTAQPAIVPNVEEQHVDNGHLGNPANLISVGAYTDHHPAVTSHPTYHFQIPTREGLNLWKGFLTLVLDAYEGNSSYGGTLTEEHLRMSESECRIEMEATHPATFENLLLDLAQLATLLIVYFETPNVLAPRCIQELFSTMTTPWLGPVPAPSVQQVENFVKFMRNHPCLKPVRKTSKFLSMVFQARRGMLAIERAPIDAAVALVAVLVDWMFTVEALQYILLNRTLWWRYNHPDNQVPVYGPTAEDMFRFLRNLFEHGADLDPNGRQMVWDMEDLDYLAAEVFSDKITEFVWHLVMGVEMSGLLTHAWADYQ